MQAAVVAVEDNGVPFCVDCDGTLVRTDLMHESVFLLLKQSPWKIALLPFWLARGRAHLKQRLAEAVTFDWPTVPLNADIVEMARQARGAGRPVVLATASHRLLADGIARHVGLFDHVVATEGTHNLSGRNKRESLVALYGERGFDYAGNGRTDLDVWAASRRATVVSESPSLADAARRVTEVERVIAPGRPRLNSYLKALRLHQWLKNLLVLVPMAAAHQLNAATLGQALLAFLSFSFCASAVYVLNDLLDLDADRRHLRKRNRPFASGVVPVWHGAVLVPVLLVVGLILALSLPLEFLGVLVFYFLLTLSYSMALKRQVIVDVLMLAGLYTLRVIAGGAATGIVPSFWLLAFSMFLFLSLALVKRYSELLVTLQQNKRDAAGRGYMVEDLPVLMSAGTSSGMVAVLVFALYINSPDVHRIYTEPHWLWLVPPLLLYWVTRLWMKARRGEIDDDPVVFALRDWQSLVVVALSGVLFLLA
jgi:4-hydroxybenzoate polyprenyltransferase/phosphoserine phosphatase